MATLFCALAAGLAARAIPISFDVPEDGKATVVIDDAGGRRVRNLVNGASFAKGRHVAEWDGRTEDGAGAEPGEYRVRTVTHPGLSYKYKGSFASGGERRFKSFGPNHNPCTATTARDGKVVAAALFTEGGNSTLILDADGRLLRGYADGWWNTGLSAFLCLPGAGRYFYGIREKKDGELQFIAYGWEEDAKFEAKVKDAPKTALKGAAQIGGAVYVANGLTGAVDEYALTESGRSATLAYTGRSRPCAVAGPLAVAPDGELVESFKPGLKSIAVDADSIYAVEE